MVKTLATTAPGIMGLNDIVKHESMQDDGVTR